MMQFKEAQLRGMLLCASVQGAYDEPEADRILLREAAKDHPGVALVVKTVRHPDPFLASHGDYMRGVFPATEI